MLPNARAAQRTSKALAGPVTVVKQDKTAWGMFCCRMGLPTIDTVFRKISVYYPNRPWRAPMDIDHDGQESKKMAKWRQRLSKSDFEVFCLSSVKPHVADALYRFSTSRINESLLEDDLTVLTKAYGRTEREQIETEANF